MPTASQILVAPLQADCVSAEAVRTSFNRHLTNAARSLSFGRQGSCRRVDEVAR